VFFLLLLFFAFLCLRSLGPIQPTTLEVMVSTAASSAAANVGSSVSASASAYELGRGASAYALLRDQKLAAHTGEGGGSSSSGGSAVAAAPRYVALGQQLQQQERRLLGASVSTAIPSGSAGSSSSGSSGNGKLVHVPVSASLSASVPSPVPGAQGTTSVAEDAFTCATGTCSFQPRNKPAGT
jgi:hypothetical protein